LMKDITYLKELDQMKDEFVSTVSHDLRSPLQLIYTYTSLLPEVGTVNERQQEFIKGINRSAKKMSNLLDDLLALAKVNAGVGMERKSCDLVQVIKKVVERFEEMANEKGLLLQTRIDTAPLLVAANTHRMDQVLSNLVDNAIKYTPLGTITVQTVADAQNVTVSVIDTGIGLTEQEQQQLFVKFYRAQNEQTAGIEGTGLGLLIAKSIVEQYGGQMWVESTWQAGSTISFSLPLIKQG